MIKKSLLFLIALFLILTHYRSVSIAGHPRAEDFKNKAEEFYSRQMYDEAIVEFKKALDLDPGDDDSHYKYGLALQNNKLYERAINEFEKTIALSPGHWQALEAGGDAYMSLDNYPAAEELYARALSLKPPSARLYLKLANVCKIQKKYNQAVENCRKALLISPQFLEARFLLAEVYYYCQEINKSIAEFRLLKNSRPLNPAVLKWLGYIYIKQADYDSAEPELEHYARLKPMDAWGHYYLALVYEKLTIPQAAILEYKRALEINPEEKKFYYDAAGFCLKQGLYDDAIAVLQPARKENIGNYALFLLAVAYGGKGDMPAMFTALKQSGVFFWAVPILSVLMFLFLFMSIGFIFLIVFLISAKRKERPISVPVAGWGLKELFWVTLLLFILPLFIGMIIGAVFYKNWFLVFLPTTNIAASSVSVLLLTQVITDILVVAIMIMFIRLKLKQAGTVLGLVRVNIPKSIIQAVLAVGVLMAISMLYYSMYIWLAKAEPPAQEISKIISSVTTKQQLMPIMILVVLIAPLAEEIIFRGFIYQGLRKYCGIGTAMFISAVIFAILHYQVSIFIPIMFMGIIFAHLYEKNKSIVPSFIAHFLWNGLSFVFIFLKI